VTAPPASEPQTASRRAHLAVATCLAVATFALYLPVRHHEFVAYDDPIAISENPHLARGLSLETIGRAFSEPYHTNWIPLTWISLHVDHALFGHEPAGYHLVNAALHSLAAALLALALTSLTGAAAPSAFVAAVFAVHPLHVESVAWAAERKDTLSGVFFMLSLFAYAAYARRARSLGRYTLVAASFAAGLLAKPMLVTLPLVLLLLDFWPLGRLRCGDPGSHAAGPRFFALLGEKLPLFGLAAAAGFVTLLVQRSEGAMPNAQQLPLAQRAMNAVESVWLYVFDSFWPQGLAIFYPHPGAASAAGTAAAAAIGLLAVTAGCARLARSHPYLLVGWLWYLATLLPVIGLIQVGLQARADRYTYLPQIGLAIALAWGARDLFAGRRGGRPALAIIAAIAIAALAVGTRLQLTHWRDTRALYTRAVAVTEGNFLAHHGLAVELLETGELEAAARHFARAVALEPRWPEAHIGLADALLEQGRTRAAVESYRRGVALAPRKPDGHAHLAQGLAQLGDLDGAIRSFRRAIELYAGETPAEVHAHLASALARRNLLTEARSQYEIALARRPDFGAAHANLGILLARLGRHADARRRLEHAVALGADTAETHAALATVADLLGDPDTAVRSYRVALELRPGWKRVVNNLAWLLATHPDAAVREPDAAVRLAESLQHGAPRPDADSLDTLAAAYAAAGRFEAAERAARDASQLARETGRDELASRIDGRSALYSARRPFIASRADAHR
jgi:Flp pilus assembly protein TadD